jgi:hypothetical protein
MALAPSISPRFPTLSKRGGPLMHVSIWTSFTLSVVLLSSAVSSAHALDLTGSWVGTMTCDVVVAENPHIRRVVRNQVVEIVMVNNWQFLLEFQDGGTASFPLFGSAVDDGVRESRGKVAAQFCQGSLAITSFLTADAVVNDATGTGSLKGQLINLLTNAPGLVETCRVDFRRTSAAAPIFDSSCP